MILRDRRIVVTGALGVLGSALCGVLHAYGAKVAAIDHAPANAAAGLSGKAILFGGIDLADPAPARDALAQAAQALGGIDGLVNVAGTFRWETVADGAADTWDLLYRVNLRTAVCASKAALPYLGAGGRILNIGAAGAVKAGTGMGAYAASKAGVAKLTEALAEELKDRGITVNALLPSIIDTPANRKDMPDAEFSRWVAPEALAEVAAFLLSERSAAVTGALIPVTHRV